MSTNLKRKVTKKTKRILLSLAAFIFAFSILISLIFIPPIQNFIVEKVTKTLSENWGSDIKIGKIYITPTLKVAFEYLVISDLRQNPMITVDKAKTRLKGLTFSSMNLAFHSLELDGVEVLLTKYEGDTSINIGMWARHLKKSDEKGDFKLHADRLIMKNSRLLIHNENTITSGNSGDYIDYAFLELNNIAFKTKDFQVNRDDISAQITKLAFSQYSGFELLNASAFFRINSKGLTFNQGKLATKHSIIYLDLSFDYSDWSSYSSFTDSVMIRARVSPSIAHFSDISRFAKALKGMDQYLVFSGNVNGTVNSLYVNNFSAFFKESNAIRGSLYMKDITDFKNGYYDVNLHETTVNIYDLTKFLLPGGKKIPIPKELYPLGNTALTASFKGDFNSFMAKLDLNSQMGNATADLALYEAHGRYLFDGKASSGGFNIGRLIPDNDILGQVAFNISLDGYSLTNQNREIDLERSYANLTGNVGRLDLFNYPIQNITLKGLLNGKKFDGHIHSADTNINFTFNGMVDLTNEMPNFRSYISVARFAPEPFLRNYHVADSTKATELNRAIYLAQQNPDLTFSFDSLEFNISGNNLDNLNGFAGVNGILFAKGNDSIYGERIRLTSISLPSGLHRFILTSNFLNTTISTNYKLSDLKDSLLTVGHRYFPNIISATTPPSSGVTEIDPLTGEPKEYYFQLSAETFQINKILNIVVPELQIAPRSTCDLYISSLQENDGLRFNTRRLVFKNKFSLHNLDIAGYSDNDSVFDLTLVGDSIVIAQEKNNLLFTNPSVKIEINNHVLTYDLQWENSNGSQNESWLSGYVDASGKDSIHFKFLSTSLSINENSWHFNEDHALLYTKEGLYFDNLVLFSGISTISAHGIFSFKEEDDLQIEVKSVDLAQFNNFSANMNLSFGGDISALLRIRNWNGQRLFTGKVLVSDLIFNNVKMGNLFATAAVPENTNIAFAGGLFDRNEPLNSATIAQYSIRNYNLEEHILANMSGYFEFDKKNLVIKADIDTLELGFLGPFFKSFSQRIDGKAQGELAFYLNPDSAYLDGKVNVLDGYLGIAPLNTVYKIVNQNIILNSQGIEFPDVEITDHLGNRAMVTGGIRHRLFKDFRFNIGIETDRLLVLNTEKAPDISFYGTGFAAGRVNMKGSGDFIRFSGSNLTTLSGTRLYLPVMFSDRVSETDGIRFRTASVVTTNIEPEQKSGILDFNFTFDITRDAEVFVELDPSIGGALSARTEGTLQVRYNSESDLVLKGLVTILSGNYHMSFRDIFLNLNMQLVEGGTIVFDGGAANSVIDAKALYRAMASVNMLDSDMPTGRTQVNAYLLLSGMLMNPSIDFEFEFPNLNSDDNLRLNTAMNASNVNSAATQFFSLVLTSNFINSSDMSKMGGEYATNAGTELFSGVINNLLFSNIGFFDEFGMNMRGMTGTGTETDATRTGMAVSFQGKKTVDRWVFQGDIGWQGNDRGSTQSATATAAALIYDFSVEYMINRKGNLRARAFVSSGNYDLNSMEDGISNSTSIIAGGSIIFKVDFNNGEDIKNAFRRQKKSKQIDK